MMRLLMMVMALAPIIVYADEDVMLRSRGDPAITSDEE